MSQLFSLLPWKRESYNPLVKPDPLAPLDSWVTLWWSLLLKAGEHCWRVPLHSQHVSSMPNMWVRPPKGGKGVQERGAGCKNSPSALGMLHTEPSGLHDCSPQDWGGFRQASCPLLLVSRMGMGLHIPNFLYLYFLLKHLFVCFFHPQENLLVFSIFMLPGRCLRDWLSKLQHLTELFSDCHNPQHVQGQVFTAEETQQVLIYFKERLPITVDYCSRLVCKPKWIFFKKYLASLFAHMKSRSNSEGSYVCY